MKITKATVKAALKRGVQMFVIADHNEMTEHQLCRDGRPVNRTEDAERILDTSRGFVVPEAVSTGGIKLSGACCDRIFLVGTEEQAIALMAERRSWSTRKVAA